jgi:DNA-binding transcriptional ArsR family regulator
MSEPARAAAPASLDEHRARKEKGHRWTRWYAEVVKSRPRLGSSALAVLGELVRRADNETGECFGQLSNPDGRRGVAEATGLSPRTVQRAIAELVDEKLITYKRTGRKRLDFCLQPMAANTSPCRIRDAKVADQTRHCDASEPPASRLSDDTVSSSSLTACRTPSSTDPPLPPAGGRSRDRDHYLEDLRTWATAEGLPVDERFEYVRVANDGHRDREAIAAYVERFTSWHDGEQSTEIPTKPLSPSPRRPEPVDAAGAGPEQLELDL